MENLLLNAFEAWGEGALVLIRNGRDDGRKQAEGWAWLIVKPALKRTWKILSYENEMSTKESIIRFHMLIRNNVPISS